MANPSDPRKGYTGDSVNETLQDRIIRHLLYLTRLQTQEANWIGGKIDENFTPDIEDRIAAAVNRLTSMSGESSLITSGQSEYLRSFTSELSAISISTMNTLYDDFFQRMVDLAKQEVEFETNLFKKTIPIELNFSQPSEDQLKQILRNQPIPLQKGGKSYTIREWFDNLSDSTIERVNGQIRQGLTEGEDMGGIMQRVRDNGLAKTKQHAQAMARTGVIHSSNQATNEFYRENDDLISGVKWIVTLDSRSCSTCMWYDANNPYDLENHPSPPSHINCRCSTTPILRSWEEMGFDAEEVPESTRASVNGQVPESMTYNDWLRKQVNAGREDIAKEALGARRYKAWVNGDAQISDFVNDSGQQLTLEQIREREGDIFGD